MACRIRVHSTTVIAIGYDTQQRIFHSMEEAGCLVFVVSF